MRRFWTIVTVLIATCSTAFTGGGNEFIEVLIEGGIVEISVTLDPPDGPPTSQSMQFPVGANGVQEFYRFEDANAEGEGYVELLVSENTSSSTLDLFLDLGADQSEFGYEVTVRVRTAEPIVFRLLDEVEASVSGGGDFLSLDPISGMFDGFRMCPGTYAITFDESLVLEEFDAHTTGGAGMSVQLNDSFDQEVRFTGAGDLSVSGNSTDDQGNKNNAFAAGTIDNSSFTAKGCTSSGLVDGDAQASGQISDGGNGSYTVSVVANAIATQPAGYAGACFIGVFGEAIVLDLEKPKAFTISGSGNGAFGVTPMTGSIDGDTMGAGRYRINFNASAQIEAGQTSAASSVDWTLSLRTPGCSGADLAPPSGMLDFSDVIAFLSAFGASDPSADLAAPTGVWDFTDVLAFLTLFGAGCP